jgi:hypothetical protein
MIRVKEMIEYLKTFNPDMPMAMAFERKNEIAVTGMKASIATISDDYKRSCDVLVLSSDEVDIETGIKFLLRKKDNVNIQDN